MRDRWRATASLIGIGWHIDRRLTTELVLSTLVLHLAQTMRALWLKLVFDAVVAHDVTAVTGWAALLVVTSVGRTAAVVRSQMSRQDLHDKAVQHFEEESMRLASAAPSITVLERSIDLDRIAELRALLPTVSDGTATAVDGLTMAVRMVVVVALLGSVDPALVGLPLLAVPSLVTGHHSQRVRNDGERTIAGPRRRVEHMTAVMTQPGPAKETMTLGLYGDFRRRVGVARDEATHIETGTELRSSLVDLVGWAVFALGYVGSILYVVSLAAKGAATPGDVLLVVVLASQVNLQVEESAKLVGLLTTTSRALSLQRWLEGTGDGRAGTASPPARLTSGMTIESLSFDYQGEHAGAVQDVSVELPAGSTVAIVGDNGAGKTTLVKLMCGLYQPDGGRILVDGVDLAAFDQRAWQARTSACYQDFVRFELLLRQAVGVGHLGAINDDEAVLTALRRAEGDEVVAGLEHGLATQLGRTFGGTDLSGGRWQKVAVARALMRPAPLLLVLDEPSSALDADAEAALFATYSAAADAVSSGCGTITVLVSHRFSTVRSADLILVLADGRIAELGSHDELIGRGGLYTELYELQAKAYL